MKNVFVSSMTLFERLMMHRKLVLSWKTSPSLVIVRSMEEQDFLSNYLFKTLKKEDNFWIGAKFSVTASHYKWLDNSDLAYSNWDSKGAENKENHCVQIQADDRLVGQWIDESCGRSNKVVCQKMPTWSMARLQKEFLDERKQHRDALESTKHELESANHILKQQLDEANKKIANLQQSSDQKVAELKQSFIPIGFIYVQLPHQSEPQSLWSAIQWKDVTSEYSGLFFRAEGANATEFGSVQEENAPKLTQVRYGEFDTSKFPEWYSTNLIPGDWSSGVGVFSGSYDGKDVYTHQFNQSGGEIRPRNMAMRFWKRI